MFLLRYSYLCTYSGYSAHLCHTSGSQLQWHSRLKKCAVFLAPQYTDGISWDRIGWSFQRLRETPLGLVSAGSELVFAFLFPLCFYSQLCIPAVKLNELGQRSGQRPQNEKHIIAAAHFPSGAYGITLELERKHWLLCRIFDLNGINHKARFGVFNWQLSHYCQMQCYCHILHSQSSC